MGTFLIWVVIVVEKMKVWEGALYVFVYLVHNLIVFEISVPLAVL